jgi:hypothetical protein
MESYVLRSPGVFGPGAESAAAGSVGVASWQMEVFPGLGLLCGQSWFAKLVLLWVYLGGKVNSFVGPQLGLWRACCCHRADLLSHMAIKSAKSAWSLFRKAMRHTWGVLLLSNFVGDGGKTAKAIWKSCSAAQTWVALRPPSLPRSRPAGAFCPLAKLALQHGNTLSTLFFCFAACQHHVHLPRHSDVKLAIYFIFLIAAPPRCLFFSTPFPRHSDVKLAIYFMFLIAAPPRCSDMKLAIYFTSFIPAPPRHSGVKLLHVTDPARAWGGFEDARLDEAFRRRADHLIAEWGARDIWSAALLGEPIVPKYHVEPFHGAEDEALTLNRTPLATAGCYPPPTWAPRNPKKPRC